MVKSKGLIAVMLFGSLLTGCSVAPQQVKEPEATPEKVEVNTLQFDPADNEKFAEGVQEI